MEDPTSKSRIGRRMRLEHVRRRKFECKLTNYTLLIVALVEAIIIVYYVITIILVSYIYGTYSVPKYERHRLFWKSILAIRYFILFTVFGFPVSLMTRKCRPIVVYGVKNVITTVYALVSSISSLVIMTTWSVEGSETDPVFRMMLGFGLTDAVVNAAFVLAEMWFVFLAYQLHKNQALTADASNGESQIHDSILDPLNPNITSILNSNRRNAMTTDIVSILLGTSVP